MAAEDTKMKTERTLKLLNILGPLYHGGLEFGIYGDLIDDPTTETLRNNYGIDPVTIESLQELAQTIVPFQTVIVKSSENDWYGDHHEWYNEWSPNGWGNCRRLHLPPLTVSPFIKIVDPFIEVSISSKEKRRSLIIDDILFASRALMKDSTRSAIDYKLLGYDDNALVLEPDIDNCST